jgi:hypothetical protein
MPCSDVHPHYCRRKNDRESPIITGCVKPLHIRCSTEELEAYPGTECEGEVPIADYIDTHWGWPKNKQQFDLDAAYSRLQIEKQLLI